MDRKTGIQKDRGDSYRKSIEKDSHMDKKIDIQKGKQNSRLPKDRNTGIQKDRGDLYCRKDRRVLMWVRR